MIIDRFNLTYFILIFITISLIVAIYFIFRKKEEKVKITFISIVCLFNIIFFFVYKYWLSQDSEFLHLSHLDKFNWWNELPLQLCNISLFLIPISLISNKKFLKNYCFFITPLGAFMAISCPEAAFVGDSIFKLRNIGFYGTHMILIITSFSIVTLGFYKPKYKDILLPAITTFGLAAIMFGVNTILRNTVCPEANYFFTYKCDVPVLSTFYKWIPVPLIYELLGIIILVPYCLLVTFLYSCFVKERKDEQNKNNYA